MSRIGQYLEIAQRSFSFSRKSNSAKELTRINVYYFNKTQFFNNIIDINVIVRTESKKFWYI